MSGWSGALPRRLDLITWQVNLDIPKWASEYGSLRKTPFGGINFDFDFDFIFILLIRGESQFSFLFGKLYFLDFWKLQT